MDNVFAQGGCRLEITDAALKVKVRFRGSVVIPLSTIQTVKVGRWHHISTIQLITPAGMYEWSFGDRTSEAAIAVAAAAGLPAPNSLLP